MSLAAGMRLGHYEIVALIGAGGMGEVYRARDPRLKRDVALKILPPSFAADRERLHRFLREAAAAGQINHPNILTVHDVGPDDRVPYLVTELLEGETLRTLIDRRQFPTALALEYAAQIASGLAAAHSRGIVHRDLKPDNVFVTRDGRVKVLDFGIAKFIDTPGGVYAAETATAEGSMLGTVGYMAPEQVVGQDVDGRADLFALGVVLCEMVTGVSPFGRATPVETLNAILKDEPSLAHVQMPGAAAAVVQALLAKDPDRRLRSADDAALMLGSAAADARKPPAPGRAPRRRRFLWLAVPMITVFAAAGWLLARSVPADRAAPVYARLTMLHGTLWSGRFAPDGQTIVYSASWENEPVQLFSTRIGSVETRPLGIHPASLLSISSRGEMALLLDPRWILTHYRVGTLARADLAGGAAREMATDVLGADWAPDGSSLAIVRAGKEDDVLEYPEGTAIYRAKGRRLHSLRVSPDGERIALFERLPESSQLTVVSRRGEATVLSRGWDVESRGLAWGPDGTEVWFSAARQSALRLMAVRLDGRERTLAEVPQSLELLDVARDGRVLVNHFLNRLTIYAGAVGGKSERIVSWLDGSFLHQISNDGNTIVFDDPRGLRLRVGQAAPVLLAPTDHWISWSALSPDGRHVAAVLEKGDAAPLTVIPTGPGPKHTISPGGRVVWAGWMDAARLVVATVRQGRLQLSRHDIRTDASDTLPVAGRTWEAIFDPQLGADMFEMSPDGRRIAIQARGEVSIVDLALGTLQRMPKTSADYSLAGWSDRDELLFYRIGDVPARVFRADIKIGVMHPWIELAPLDRSGLWRVHPVRISPKGSYAYLTTQYLSDLYLVTGLK